MEEVFARKEIEELLIHGDRREDPYFWMNRRDDEEVLNYLEAENSYTKAGLKPVEDLQNELFDEIVKRIPKDDESVPYQLRLYWYYVRYEKGGEYPIYCRKKGSLDAEEEILLDGNKMAEGKSFFKISGLSISEDEQRLSYGTDETGRRIYTIHVKDLKSGEHLEDVIEETTSSSVWSTCDKYLFYSKKDDSLRPATIWRHTMGSDQEDDVLIYEEKDETFVTYCYKSKSRSFIIIGCASTVSNEYRYISSNEPLSDFALFQERERGHEYGVAHFGDQFFIRTNKDGATNFKLMRCPLNRPGKENWTELIPHRSDVLLEGIEIFKDYLVREERFNGLNKIVIREWSGSEHELQFDEESYSCWVGQNPEFETDKLRFGYTSLTQPSSVLEYDMQHRDRKLLKQQRIEGGYDGALYESKRVFIESHDHTKVAVSIVYRKDTFKKSESPCLLYGYGSYGHTIDPYFSSVRLSLLDRGFVFAIAHVRGSEYLGRKWYEEGRQLKKMNTFLDFIAAGNALLELGYASVNGLYAMGGSAGGLLMGVVMNMSPNLFKGIVASVPFVDVVTTMLDESIPLTTGEYDEWGNPNEEEYYRYMKSYSPYDNVGPRDYPALFVNTGYHDSQVQYWEPAKWVAKLRDLRTNKEPLFFHCDMESGHSGPSGRFSVHRDTAMEYSFLLGLEENIL